MDAQEVIVREMERKRNVKASHAKAPLPATAPLFILAPTRGVLSL